MGLSEAAGGQPVDVRAGNLHIRLAETSEEVSASQELRFRVFCEEMTAKPTREMAAAGREFDSFDAYCDHLLVFDHDRGKDRGPVVGTYRLMRREPALRRGQFYTSDEYDISKLLTFKGEILEVGRSCVDLEYRSRAIMQLLWRGIAAYVTHYDIDIMFGCASLPGVDPGKLSVPLAYLYHNHLAPAALRPRARPERFVRMDALPPEQASRDAAWTDLPPLIKGYLRLGGFVGDGAVVDEMFGTTDVCIVVKTDRMTEKYYRHYSLGDGSRPHSQT